MRVGRHPDQRVAIRGGASDDVTADCAVGARPILDDDRLLELLAQRLRDLTSNHVAATTGRPGHDHLDRFVGVLGGCSER